MNSPWPGVATQIYIVPATSSAAETVSTVSSGEQLAGLQVGNTLFHSTRKTNRNFWTDVTLIKKHPGNIWVPHWNMSFAAGPNITDHCPAHNSIRFKHHCIKKCLRHLSCHAVMFHIQNQMYYFNEYKIQILTIKIQIASLNTVMCLDYNFVYAWININFKLKIQLYNSA